MLPDRVGEVTLKPRRPTPRAGQSGRDFLPHSIPRSAEASGLEDLPAHLAGYRAALVISGPSRRHFERLAAVLPSLRLEPFAEARRHVPLALVERAARELHASGADVVVALGGGSSIGLGKALRLRSSFFFVAIPTTYAGSEATDIHGVTSASEKVTGRDSRVVPDLVVYDPSLLLDMPLSLSVTSLMNALAHPVSALSTGSLDATWHPAALAASASVYRAIVAVLEDPQGLEA
jgi:maleylacetate reductase